MTLPELTLPKIDLPFDIPVLIHPSIDHFAIVLPVVVLLLEFYNLFAKRKSIGVFSFILLILTVVAFAAAYFTGVVDGKEAYDLLPTEGQEELKFHKLLGTYLLLGSVALLFFKLLAMTGKKLLKVLFFIVLLGFIAVTFQQGKDGGELVYEYGANVERVKALDDKLFDAQDALEELDEKKKETDKEEKDVSIKKEDPVKQLPVEVVEVEEEVQEEVKVEVKEEVKEEVQKAPSNITSTQINQSVEEQSVSTQEELVENTGSVKTEENNIDSEVKEEATTNSIKVKEQLSDNISSPKIPAIPSVPEVTEVIQSEEVPENTGEIKTKELPKFENSFKELTSDLERLKIETH